MDALTLLVKQIYLQNIFFPLQKKKQKQTEKKKVPYPPPPPP